MLLNNTMNIFDPHPGNANSIAPGKRMVSSMAPTVVMKDVIHGAACWRADGTPAGFSRGPAKTSTGDTLYRF